MPVGSEAVVLKPLPLEMSSNNIKRLNATTTLPIIKQHQTSDCDGNAAPWTGQSSVKPSVLRRLPTSRARILKLGAVSRVPSVSSQGVQGTRREIGGLTDTGRERIV
jgi:hypothetical protein